MDTRKDAFETQFFFYYYGHGLPEGLLLGDELYSKTALKKELALINARIKFIFLDSCSAEVLGSGEFLDFSTQSEGTVFITSSSLFEQAFTSIFTPILKAGLMGDADGYIPEQFAAPFFYKEINTKLSGEEKNYIQELYGFKEYYDYQEGTSEQEAQVKKILATIGIKDIPSRSHFSWLCEEVLPALKNNQERELFQSLYNYHELCSLDKKITPAEKKRIKLILEKAGFRKDNYITLNELFSYIRSRAAAIKTIRQTPTINTNMLSLKETIRLAYNENKIAVFLTYPGTIWVHRLTDENLLDLLVTLTPRLDAGDPVRINLSPGLYTFIIECERIKYRVDKMLFPKDQEIVLDLSDKNSRVIYREEPALEKNFFSYSYGVAGSFSVFNNTTLNVGGMPMLALQYNFNFTWGVIGLGIMSGCNWQTADAAEPFNYLAYPIMAYGRFITRFPVPYFIFFDLGGGSIIEQVIYSNPAKSAGWGSKGYFSTGLGAGVKLSDKFSLALKGHVALAIFDFDKYYITGLLGVELLNKF